MLNRHSFSTALSPNNSPRRWKATYQPLVSYWEEDGKGRRTNTLMLDILQVCFCPDNVRDTAILRLAEREDFLSTGFSDRKARTAVRVLIRLHGVEGFRRRLRKEVFPKAIFLALSERGQPRRIRLGRGSTGSNSPVWVRELESGSVLRLKPDELPSPAFRVWFKQRAQQIAADMLVQDLVDGKGLSIEQEAALEAPATAIEDEVFSEEPGANDDARSSGGTEPALSSREEHIVALAEKGLTYAEIGFELGISREAAKKAGARLGRKLGQPLFRSKS